MKQIHVVAGVLRDAHGRVLLASRTEGRDLAIETSHTLTVPIVEYTTNKCGLSFGDES